MFSIFEVNHRGFPNGKDKLSNQKQVWFEFQQKSTNKPSNCGEKSMAVGMEADGVLFTAVAAASNLELKLIVKADLSRPRLGSQAPVQARA